MRLKKSTLKRQAFPLTSREIALRLVRLAFTSTKGLPKEKSLLVAARMLISEARRDSAPS